MNFKRGVDIKQALDMGIIRSIREEMEDSLYDFEIFLDVWLWALSNKRNEVFQFLVSFDKKRWRGKFVSIRSDNNHLLWTSIEKKNESAVEAILTVPALFRKEALKIDRGISRISGAYTKRGNKKLQVMGANFGNFIYLASHHYPNENIVRMLQKYYERHKNE